MKRHIKTLKEFINENLLYESFTDNMREVFSEHKTDELADTSAADAYKIAVDMMGKDNAEKIYGDEKDFSKRYDAAQASAKKYGKYQRGEMPVINNSNFKGSGVGKEDEESAPRKKEVESVLDKADAKQDIKKAVLSNQVLAFKFLVGNGFIDITGADKDLAKKTQEDLYRDDSLAKNWLSAGAGPKENADKVKGEYENIPVKDLKPIQEQIFVVKAIKMGAETEGNKEEMNWLLKPGEKAPYTIVSKDNFILDGHHRWLGAYLVDPDTDMKCVKIDMTCQELLDLTNKFTGAIGNKPNTAA